MAAFCPYKITDRKIIKVEHNIIDSSRCLKPKGKQKKKFSLKLFWWSHKYFTNKVCVYILYSPEIFSIFFFVFFYQSTQCVSLNPCKKSIQYLLCIALQLKSKMKSSISVISNPVYHIETQFKINWDYTELNLR
jgi:hypothetical protein